MNNPLDRELKRRQFNNKQLTSIYLIFLLIVGGILSYITWNISSKLESSTCKAESLKKLRTLNKITLAISVSMIIGTISSIICFYKCDSLTGYGVKTYMFLNILLSAVLITLSAITMASAPTECTSDISGNNVILVTGIIVFLVSAFILYKDIKFKL